MDEEKQYDQKVWVLIKQSEPKRDRDWKHNVTFFHHLVADHTHTALCLINLIVKGAFLNVKEAKPKRLLHGLQEPLLTS